MRTRHLALAASGLLVATIVAVAMIFFVPRWLAASLATAVNNHTGRELVFADVVVNLLPAPALALSQVRFANVAWGAQPWLAQAGRVSASIDLAALLSGRLAVRNIAVSDATVFLETDADGNGNWVLGTARSALPAWLQALTFDEFTLRAVAITYRDGTDGKTMSVQLDNARLGAPVASEPMHLGLAATFDGRRVEVDGTLGALAALVMNQPAYPVDLAGKLGAASVRMQGTIGNLRELAGLDLSLRAQAPEFAELGVWLGTALPALGRYRISARAAGSTAAPVLSAIDVSIGGRESGTPEIRLQGAVANLREASGFDLRLQATADEWWRIDTVAGGLRLPPFHASASLRDAGDGYSIDGLELSIAGSSVSASLQVARLGSRLRVTGTAASPLIDLARLPPGTTSALAGATASNGATDYWKLADLDLSLNIGRLVLPDGRQLQAGSGRLALDNGRLEASALQATLAGARVQLDGSISDPRQLSGLDLGISVQGGELAQLLQFFGTSIVPVGPYQGRAQMRGSLDAIGLTAIDASVGRRGQSVRASGHIGDVANRQGVELALTANINDSTAAGRLFGVDLPRLPALKAAARLTAPQGSYVFDDLTLTLGRTSVQGRAAFVPGASRPHVTATLGGPLVDLSELPARPTGGGTTNPLLAADVDAELHFERVLLPDRRALGPVGGAVRLTAGALEMRDFTLAVDGARATVNGRINDPLALSGIDLLVRAELTRGAGLATFTGLGLRKLPPFSATGKLTDVPDGYALAGLKLVSAITTIDGDVAVTRGVQRFKVVAKVKSPSLDISAFVRRGAKGRAPKPAADGARAIADLPLPLDLLRVVDAELDLRIDALGFDEKAPVGPLQVRATLANGLLKAESVQLVIQAGQTLNGSGTVDATKTAWSLRVQGSGIDLGQTLVRFGRAALVTGGRTDLSLRLEGQGDSLAAILGSLNGDARMQVGAFDVHGFVVDLNASLALRLLGNAIPSTRTDPDTHVNCLAVRVPVSNGVWTSERNVAAETVKYNAVLSGTVNLRTEVIDVAVTPIAASGPGGGRGTVPVVVHVGGTLGAPVLSVNPVEVAVKSAARIGGLWLVDALIRMAASDKSPCATALSP